MTTNDANALYLLRIVSAQGLPKAPMGKLPKAFIEVVIDDQKFKTDAHDRSVEPIWNADFQLAARNPYSLLALKIFHKSLLVSKPWFLCGLEIQVDELKERCEPLADHEICLPLRNGKGVEQGKITLQFTASDHLDTAALVLAQKDKFESFAYVIEKLDTLVSLVDETSQIHPYVYITWKIVSSVYQIIQAQVARDQKVIELAQTMEDVYVFVDAVEEVPNKIKVLEDAIKNILNETVECAIFIQEYSGHGFSGRLFHSLFTDHTQKIDKLREGLLGLKNKFDSGLSAQATFVSSRIQCDVLTLVIKQTLGELRPAEMDTYGRLRCLSGTRVDILSFITKWATSPSVDTNVLWLYGLPGSGKSTVATTVSDYFSGLGRLGSFLYFDRNFPDRSHPSKVIRTLAYHVAVFDSRIAAEMSAAITKNPRICESSALLQFLKLIIEPLSAIESLRTEGPVVIVLDALDECGTSTSRAELLKILTEQSFHLPPSLRILITSRPQTDVLAAMESQTHILPVELEITSAANQKDIQSYLRFRMTKIRQEKKHVKLGDEWPGDEVICSLVDRASGLFVWASTASDFINSHNPTKRMQILLQNAPSSGAELALDSLYKFALESTGDWADEDFASDVQAILGIVIVSRMPLSCSSLNWLLDQPEDRPIEGTVSQLGCILQQRPTVRVLHPSFADFVCSRSRCGSDAWFIDTNYHNRHLAVQCLRVLLGALKYNLCDIGLHLPPPSFDQLDKGINEGVSHACNFWVDYVCVVEGDTESLMELLKTFLNRHLLHWFEVMSILKKSRDTITLLDRLLDWILLQPAHEDGLASLVRDGSRFARVFARSIEEHPLLVYLAALPFTPTDTSLYRLFHDPDLYPTVAGGFDHFWSPLLFIFTEHTDWVSSVAFSRGNLIASGSDDNTIRVWSAISGAEILPAICGHKKSVSAVAFSHDGSRLASGSWDTTVRVWDISDGREVFPPLQGHEKCVSSVTFSPDGTRIASGGDDGTICIWNALSGLKIFHLSQEYQGPMEAVTFSPDGSRIICGLHDRSIRAWDATSGTQIYSLRGHDHHVRSVAFFPDGTRIVSGSQDTTIRVWNVNTGSEVFPALRGHESCVSSVAVSPDGGLIVSGSWDKTIRLWRGDSETAIFRVLEGHIDWVRSVAFSPDGRYVISASNDKTVRVWDAVSDNKHTPQQTDSGSAITQLYFSNDGSSVFSNTENNRPERWNSTTGARGFYASASEWTAEQPLAWSPCNVMVVDGDWVVDASSDGPTQVLSKLPPLLKRFVDRNVNCFASVAYGRCLAVGTQSGRVVILHFPPSLWQRSGGTNAVDDASTSYTNMPEAQDADPVERRVLPDAPSSEGLDPLEIQVLMLRQVPAIQQVCIRMSDNPALIAPTIERILSQSQWRLGPQRLASILLQLLSSTSLESSDSESSEADVVCISQAGPLPLFVTEGEAVALQQLRKLTSQYPALIAPLIALLAERDPDMGPNATRTLYGLFCGGQLSELDEGETSTLEGRVLCESNAGPAEEKAVACPNEENSDAKVPNVPEADIPREHPDNGVEGRVSATTDEITFGTISTETVSNQPEREFLLTHNIPSLHNLCTQISQHENSDLMAALMEKLAHPETDHVEAISLFHSFIIGRHVDIIEREDRTPSQVEPIRDTQGNTDGLDDIRVIYDFVRQHPDQVEPMVKELAEEDPDMTQEEAAELLDLLSSVHMKNRTEVNEDILEIYNFISQHPDLINPIVDELVAEDPDMTPEEVAELLKLLRSVGAPDIGGVDDAYDGSPFGEEELAEDPGNGTFLVEIICGLISEHPDLIPSLIQDLKDMTDYNNDQDFVENLETALYRIIKELRELHEANAETRWKDQ